LQVAVENGTRVQRALEVLYCVGLKGKEKKSGQKIAWTIVMMISCIICRVPDGKTDELER